MSKIFLIIDRKQEGPFSNEQVRDKLVAGVIDGETFARLDEGSEWFPLSNFLDVSAFARAKKAGPPTRPVLVWVISILYIAYYSVVIRMLAMSLIRFSGAPLSYPMFWAVFLVAILKIVAGILLLLLRKSALLLLLAAFAVDLLRLIYIMSIGGWHGAFRMNPTMAVTSWLIQVAILVYAGSLMKNRTLR